MRGRLARFPTPVTEPVTGFDMAVLPCPIMTLWVDAAEGSDILHTAHVTSTYALYQCEVSP